MLMRWCASEIFKNPALPSNVGGEGIINLEVGLNYTALNLSIARKRVAPKSTNGAG